MSVCHSRSALAFVDRRVLCLILILFGGCTDTSHERLFGTWQSDAEKTLVTIGNADYLLPEDREFLEAGFFGHLVIEYREDEFTWYLDDSDDPPVTNKYSILEVAENSMRLCDLDETEQCTEYEIVFEDDCYFVDVSDGMGFVEYFCRVEG